MFPFLTGFFLGLLSRAIYLFKIQDFYERRKRHQELLIDSLKEWLKPPDLGSAIDGGFPIKCPDPSPQDFDTYVSQHLVSENPRAIELLRELKDIYSRCKILRSRLIEEVRDEVSKKYEELGGRLFRVSYDVKNFIDKVVYEIDYELEYGIEVIKPSRRFKDGEFILELNGAEVARSSDDSAIDELEKLFNELVQSEELRNKTEKIIEMRREYNEKLEELRSIIEEIVTRCEHGNKLGGKCDICPKFTWI